MRAERDKGEDEKPAFDWHWQPLYCMTENEHSTLSQ